MRAFMEGRRVGACIAVFVAIMPPRAAPASEGEILREAVVDLRRACASAATRLALDPADAGPEAMELLRRGGTLLSEIAEGAESSSRLEAVLEAVDEAAASAVAAIVEAKARAFRQLAIDPAAEVSFDPWAGPDQESGFVPPDLGPVTADEGFDLPEIDLGELPARIPARYRLAEWLGLGRNRVAVVLTWIDPRQFRRQVDAEWTIVVRARLRCELIGRFVPGNGEKNRPDEMAPAGEEPPPLDLETFRVVVESRARCDAGINRSGADLGNPNAFLIEDRGFADALKPPIPDNPWHREKLAAAAAERGWRLERLDGGGPVTASPDWLDAAIGRRLADLRAAMLDRMRHDAEVIEASGTWRACLGSLERRLGDALAATPPALSAGRFAAQAGALEALDPADIVASGSLDADALARIVPATRRALASVRRAIDAATAAPGRRVDAALLAADLDRLQELLER